MNRGIYSLASGMVATQQAMEVVSNNLANVNTTGFKRDGVSFNDALEQAISTSDGRTLGTLGSGGTVKQQFTDLGQGQLKSTNDPLDLALNGKGMFAVLGPGDQVMYTRDGALTPNSQGYLATSAGYRVLDASLKPIAVKPGATKVAKDGSISADENGSYAQIGVFEGTFSKNENGLYSSTDATRAAQTQVTQGSLETSNVTPITSMTDMITLGRNFDTAQKALWSQDEMTQKLASVLS